MAITKKITFEGNTYHLGNKDRVAAHSAVYSGDVKRTVILQHDGNSTGGAPWVQDAEVVTAWSQPANTFINHVILLVSSAPTTAASISLGWEVGTASSGAQICAGDITDGIIDVGTDGTDLAAGAAAHCTPVQQTLDAVTLAADASYTSASRTIYFTTAASDHAVTTAGEVQWIIEYYDIGNATVKSGTQ